VLLPSYNHISVNQIWTLRHWPLASQELNARRQLCKRLGENFTLLFIDLHQLVSVYAKQLTSQSVIALKAVAKEPSKEARHEYSSVHLLVYVDA
jgi:hypothetical protein